MDFSQVLTPPGFALPKQSIVANKTSSVAVNKRKRFRESTPPPSALVQTARHDQSGNSHNPPDEPTDAPAIKQRAVSALPVTSAMAESAGSGCLSSTTPFILTAEQQQEAGSDARLLAAIEHFPSAMRKQLLNFRYDQHIKTILTNASVMLALLNAREISLSLRRKEPSTPTLFYLLERCSLTKEHQMISDYFGKATVFFSAVNAEKITNTGCLSSMLQCKRNIRAFNSMADDEIQRIASNPLLKHMACIYTGKGLPDPASLEEFETEATAKSATIDPALEEIVSKFHPTQQRRLRNNLDNERYRTVINCADTLIGTLNQRGIRLKHGKRRNTRALLLDIIKNLDLDKDFQLILSFFRQTMLFFINVDTARVETTECLHNMVQHRIHIEILATMNDIDIITVARHPLLVSISQRFRNSGLPDPALIGKITQLKEIKEVLLSPPITNTSRADAALERIIHHFAPDQHTELRQYQHTQCIQILLRKATNLIDTLEKRGIKLAMNRYDPPYPSLFSTLKCFTVIDDYHLMIGYFHKSEVFFSAVNAQKIRDTGCFSGMFRRKVHVRSLTEMSDDNVRKFARSPCLQYLCSANTYKGVPDLDRINDFAELDKLHGRDQMLSIVTAICYLKGFPSAAEVLSFCHILQGQDQMVISAIASMCKGRGMPDNSLLNDFLTLNFAHKKETLGTLAMVCRSKGIPPADKVNEFLQWLPAEQTITYMRLLCQFFIGTNMPEPSALTEQEKVLETIFCKNLPPQTNLLLPDQFKSFALFCLNPGKWRLDSEEFKDFLDATHFLSRHLALNAMQSIVFNLGGPGVRLWLAKYHDNFEDMDTVTKALRIPASLEMVSFALSKLPASQWLTYIDLCKKLSPMPNQKQWKLLQEMMQIVDDQFPTSDIQKQILLSILWSQDDCWIYVSQIDRLLKTVPTIRQLHHVYLQLSKQKMKAFLDACLTLHPRKSGQPKLPAIEALVDGLLLAHYPISCSDEIPDLCFSKISEQDASVTVDGTTVLTGRERLWHFVAVMLMELNRVGYDYTNRQLTFISPHGGVIRLPKPRFTLTSSGFIILNWSNKQLQGFFRATDFQDYNTRSDICEKIAQDHRHRAAKMDAEEAENAQAQAINNGPVWEEGTTDCNLLIEPLDFSWLEREFDFPEDMTHLNPERSEMERMSVYLESELNAPLHNI